MKEAPEFSAEEEAKIKKYMDKLDRARIDFGAEYNVGQLDLLIAAKEAKEQELKSEGKLKMEDIFIKDNSLDIPDEDTESKAELRKFMESENGYNLEQFVHENSR